MFTPPYPVGRRRQMETMWHAQSCSTWTGEKMVQKSCTVSTPWQANWKPRRAISTCNFYGIKWCLGNIWKGRIQTTIVKENVKTYDVMVRWKDFLSERYREKETNEWNWQKVRDEEKNEGGLSKQPPSFSMSPHLGLFAFLPHCCFHLLPIARLKRDSVICIE